MPLLICYVLRFSTPCAEWDYLAILLALEKPRMHVRTQRSMSTVTGIIEYQLQYIQIGRLRQGSSLLYNSQFS
jgi:hypothetical protein